MSFNPFVSLQWLISGKTVDGQTTREPSELVNRLEALELYTHGSAWFAHADHDRGDLSVGLFADLAVLDKDYLTVSEEKISTIRSLLTLIGGEVVYSAGIIEATSSR